MYVYLRNPYQGAGNAATIKAAKQNVQSVLSEFAQDAKRLQ